jgi:hypothetical protein
MGPCAGIGLCDLTESRSPNAKVGERVMAICRCRRRSKVKPGLAGRAAFSDESEHRAGERSTAATSNAEDPIYQRIPKRCRCCSDLLKYS